MPSNTDNMMLLAVQAALCACAHAHRHLLAAAPEQAAVLTARLPSATESDGLSAMTLTELALDGLTEPIAVAILAPLDTLVVADAGAHAIVAFPLAELENGNVVAAAPIRLAGNLAQLSSLAADGLGNVFYGSGSQVWAIAGADVAAMLRGSDANVTGPLLLVDGANAPVRVTTEGSFVYWGGSEGWVRRIATDESLDEAARGAAAAAAGDQAAPAPAGAFLQMRPSRHSSDVVTVLDAADLQRAAEEVRAVASPGPRQRQHMKTFHEKKARVSRGTRYAAAQKQVEPHEAQKQKMSLSLFESSQRSVRAVVGASQTQFAELAATQQHSNASSAGVSALLSVSARTGGGHISNGAAIVAAQLPTPVTALCIGGTGSLLVGSQAQVWQTRPMGSLVLVSDGQLQSMHGCTFDGDGSIYLADSGQGIMRVADGPPKPGANPGMVVAVTGVKSLAVFAANAATSAVAAALTVVFVALAL